MSDYGDRHPARTRGSRLGRRVNPGAPEPVVMPCVRSRSSAGHARDSDARLSVGTHPGARLTSTQHSATFGSRRERPLRWPAKGGDASRVRRLPTSDLPTFLLLPRSRHRPRSRFLADRTESEFATSRSLPPSSRMVTSVPATRLIRARSCAIGGVEPMSGAVQERRGSVSRHDTLL